MMNLKQVFLRTMMEEVWAVEDNGILLSTPTTVCLPTKAIANPLNLQLPASITQIYEQTAHLKALWHITDTKENIKQFEEDAFLIEKYFNNDYSWGVVQDFLAGFINITHSKDIFNPEFNQNQSFYYALKNKKNENENDFFAFDIQDVTACLKQENSVIIDNVWLVHSNAGTLYDMKITIEQYLQLAYDAKCIYHWQLVFLFKKKPEEFEIMKRFLPKIFNHIKLDLSAFGI